MSQQDQLYRYLFAKHAVRGELVTVSDTWHQTIVNHQYPLVVQNLLGELLVVTALLTATLKFEGEITVQLQGNGPLKLAVVNGNHHQQMRALARTDGDIPTSHRLQDLTGNNGYLVITIKPQQGEHYQGIIALEYPTLAENLEMYFLRSEQLKTRLFIHTRQQGNQPNAGGILLQILPSEQSEKEAFEHLATLTQTLTAEELFDLSASDILWRLYHQEEVSLYDPVPVCFHCHCSRERCSAVLQTLSKEEIDTMLQEDGKIDMHCDYCGKHYIYHTNDIHSPPSSDTPSRHPLH